MPYNPEIDDRIQRAMAGWRYTEAKKMFGGVCHLYKGHMVCGVYKDFLILRLGEEQAAKTLQSDNVQPFDITGRPMKGWVMVSGNGFKTDADLNSWLMRAAEFVRSLPPK